MNIEFSVYSISTETNSRAGVEDENWRSWEDRLEWELARRSREGWEVVGFQVADHQAIVLLRRDA